MLIELIIAQVIIERVTCDYRVITAREMRVKHEAIAECFTYISIAVITR